MATARNRIMRGAGRWATVAIAACLAAGCGVKGGLEKPPSEAVTPTASAESGQGKPANAAPKPHEPFILDRLIR